jgi:hypothetical protein
MWYSLEIMNADKKRTTMWTTAPTLLEAIAEARYELEKIKGQRVSIAGRKVIGEEWDCDSWTISGHIPHKRKGH